MALADSMPSVSLKRKIFKPLFLIYFIRKYRGLSRKGSLMTVA
jgi:hypothetical protein